MTTKGNIILAEFSGLRAAPISETDYSDSLATCIRAREEAEAEGDLQNSGHASRGLAECLRRIGRTYEAAQEYDSALAKFSKCGDERGLAWTFWARGNLERQTSEFSKAKLSLRFALREARRSADPKLFAYACAGIAETTRIEGNFTLSEKQHFRVFKLFRNSGDVRGIVWALEGTAQMLRLRGFFREALERFSEARALAASSGDLRGLAYAFKCRAETLSELGHHSTALEEIEIAANIFSGLRFATGYAHNLTSHGDILRRAGLIDKSLNAYSKALSLFHSSNDCRGSAYARLGWAEALLLAGLRTESAIHLRCAGAYFVKNRIASGAKRYGILASILRNRFGHRVLDDLNRSTP